MTVWGEMMKNIQPEPLEPVMPENIEMVNVDPVSGLRYDKGCKAGILLPFIKGSAPAQTSRCGDASAAKAETKPGDCSRLTPSRGPSRMRGRKTGSRGYSIEEQIRLVFCFGVAAVACRMCRRGNAADNCRTRLPSAAQQPGGRSIIAAGAAET